jgi:ApbE superfamily uncharacterized protein (UPF0280 family)
MSGPARALLPDGRLHLQHGPIDVIAQAWGSEAEVLAAYEQAWIRFETVLDELVRELSELRRPVGGACPHFGGKVARRMAAAVWPHRAVYVTPMAAVAGAVADELREAMLAGRRLRKAYVNDGGDIALHLSAGESLNAGIVANIARPGLDAVTTVRSEDPIRGIATSGWRGRSQSLGIADAVTVLAASAAQADAAATLVANAVNVEHPAIARRPARALKEDSDLGELPVTTSVAPLPAQAVQQALRNGLLAAKAMQESGLIAAACLALQGRTEVLSALEACPSLAAS